MASIDGQSVVGRKLSPLPGFDQLCHQFDDLVEADAFSTSAGLRAQDGGQVRLVRAGTEKGRACLTYQGGTQETDQNQYPAYRFSLSCVSMSIQRPEQHQIDEDARNIFKSVLPSAWTKVEQHPDYGIDFTVELFESGPEGTTLATGVEFQVQLKGTRRLAIGAGCICFPFTTRHLVQYLDSKRRPVFLVVIDVANKVGYWCFLQGYALDELARKDWRSQKTVTIRVPTKNRLNDFARLRAAVVEADTRMAEIRPGAIRGAIKAEEARIESKDRRVKVRITATEDGITHHLRPLEPITGRLTFSGKAEDVQRAVSDVVDRGLPVNAAEYGIEMTAIGLPGAPNDANAITTVSAQRSIEGLVRIAAVDESGSERGSLELPGNYEGGQKELRFSASLPSHVLSLHVCTTIGRPMRCKFQLDLSPWFGQVLTQLADFDRLAHVFARLDEQDHFRVEVLMRGNSVGRHDSPAHASHDLIGIGVMIRWLEKARFIAREVKKDLCLPGPLRPEWVEQVDFCFRFLMREAIPVRMSDVSLSTRTSGRDEVRKGQRETAKSLALESDSFEQSVFGQSVNLGPVQFRCDEATLEAVSVRSDPELARGQFVEWKVLAPSGWSAQALAKARSTGDPDVGQIRCVQQ